MKKKIDLLFFQWTDNLKWNKVFFQIISDLFADEQNVTTTSKAVNDANGYFEVSYQACLHGVSFSWSASVEGGKKE